MSAFAPNPTRVVFRTHELFSKEGRDSAGRVLTRITASWDYFSSYFLHELFALNLAARFPVRMKSLRTASQR